MNMEQKYIKTMEFFLEKNYEAKPYEIFNYAENKIIRQEGYFIIEFEETGKIRIHPSIDDYHKPYTYTCFIYFEEEKGVKYFELNGRKWNIHGIKSIKEIQQMLTLRFQGLKVVEEKEEKEGK